MKSRHTRKIALYKRVSNICSSILVQSSIETAFDVSLLLQFLGLVPSSNLQSKSAKTFDFNSFSNSEFLDEISLIFNSFSASQNDFSKVEATMQETEKRESTQKAVSGDHGIDLIVLKNINHLFTILRLEEWVPLLKRWFSLASAVGVKVVVLLNADLLPSSKSKYHGISYQAILQDLTQLHVDVDVAPDNGKLTCKLFLKKLSGRVERDEFIYSIDLAGKVFIQESAQESVSDHPSC